MSTASEKELDDLHGTIARKLTGTIDAMETGDKGLAAILNVARQFVKDNNVQAVPANGSPTGNLRDKLKQFPYDPNSDTHGRH